MSQSDSSPQTTGAGQAGTPPVDEQGRRIWTDAELADRAVWNAHRDEIIKAARDGRVRS